ncbi:CRISPR-associated endonuclease Cas6 [Emticicia sp. 17c]|uniref:CRISPR-associated endonuclease Cas6 n=1 Tax=Emticicia sp. 17c TaxID=3127704 RepID=UPI00301B9DCE
MAKVKTLKLLFPDTPLRSGEIRFFRSLINNALDWQEPLFHYHKQQGGEVYEYPLVHFRSNKGKAMLFGINEGCEAISSFIMKHLDELPPEMQTIEIDSQMTTITMCPEPVLYYVRYFLPLNSANFSNWIQIRGLKNKITELERIIAGNILDFCSAVGFQVLNKSLTVEIETLGEVGLVPFPTHTGEIKMMAFNLAYWANIILPDNIAIGKGKSKGYGVQTTTDIGLQSKTYKSIRNTETYLKKHRKTTN